MRGREYRKHLWHAFTQIWKNISFKIPSPKYLTIIATVWTTEFSWLWGPTFGQYEQLIDIKCCAMSLDLPGFLCTFLFWSSKTSSNFNPKKQTKIFIILCKLILNELFWSDSLERKVWKCAQCKFPNRKKLFVNKLDPLECSLRSL